MPAARAKRLVGERLHLRLQIAQYGRVANSLFTGKAVLLQHVYKQNAVDMPARTGGSQVERKWVGGASSSSLTIMVQNNEEWKEDNPVVIWGWMHFIIMASGNEKGAVGTQFPLVPPSLWHHMRVVHMPEMITFHAQRYTFSTMARHGAALKACTC
mmetsp:Transcript_16971/g.23743  ORF Transcript_16971/g.23743 Transcript_16971/m.23743 type:complete len:156 (-) Transcript_16971:55-522(-)